MTIFLLNVIVAMNIYLLRNFHQSSLSLDQEVKGQFQEYFRPFGKIIKQQHIAPHFRDKVAHVLNKNIFKSFVKFRKGVN
jgi:hypothetical protein